MTVTTEELEEIAARVLQSGERIYEVPITYDGRGYKEGKKITWRDGVEAATGVRGA